MVQTDDAACMRLAIEEAKKGEGKTFPNPIVGCVIVEGNEVVAKGFHEKAGSPHAEVNALSHLGRAAKEGARLYVTLEPCSTVGKTGPCTNAIITSGIKEVVVGTIDPNPQHKGRGIEILKQAGINVRVGVLDEECRDLNMDFNERMKEAGHGK
jgi:diaminohydroxyphosphoribosylaminopyrimidine deaminase/5-amino-6-(5-phosphoribosylamino)uracil reductase